MNPPSVHDYLPPELRGTRKPRRKKNDPERDRILAIWAAAQAKADAVYNKNLLKHMIKSASFAAQLMLARKNISGEL